MPFLTQYHKAALPAVLPQNDSSPPSACSEPKVADTWDYGFKRLVPLIQSPPFGAGILAITLFMFIVLSSDVLLAQANLATLGITVTLGTFAILALIVFILFLF